MKLILDTDPGHDDFVAIVLAHHVAEIVAITTVSGNAPLADTTTNALVAADLVGFDGPVFSGADRPRARAPVYPAMIHGDNGLAGPPRPTPQRGVAGTDAAGAILDLADSDTWLVPIGPLTNVAAAIERDGSLPDRLAGISIMGGATATGNVTAVAEFNIWADPESADIVFRSGARLRMCGLDLTHQVRVDDRFVDGLREPFVAALCRQYVANTRATEAAETGAAMHDPCAVLAVTHPDLFELVDRPVRVECAGDLTRGMTVVDRRPWATDPNVAVATHIDAPAALDLVAAAVNSLV